MVVFRKSFLKQRILITATCLTHHELLHLTTLTLLAETGQLFCRATNYELDDPEFVSRQGQDIPSLECPELLWDPPSFLFNGYRGSFPGVRRPGAWCWLLTSSAEVKNDWNVTVFPRHVFMVWAGAHFLPFLGAFAKFRRATISFVMFVRLSVRPHETTRLPLNGFSWNLVFEYFSKNCRQN